MENSGDLKLQVGQLAELKTFDQGYRGAWFRCKIRNIIPEKNKIQLEYYDFEEEEISWENIRKAAPYGRKSKQIKKQLMLRPRYPLLYHKNEMPGVIISEVCVVIDGKWKVGDMVDWYCDSCYWSARVIKVLSDHKVEIELPMPPAGEGEGDNLRHEALCKDLRPFLNWSETKGWTLPTQTSCSAQLIFPSNQGMDLEVEDGNVNASSMAMDLQVDNAAGVNVNVNVNVNASSSSLASAERQSSNPVISEEKVQNEDDVKMDDEEFVESSESISSLRVEAAVTATETATTETETATDEGEGEGDIVDDYKTELNIMHEDTVEAAIIDLEELVNKIKWMKNILNNQAPTTNTNTNTRSGSWKFV